MADSSPRIPVPRASRRPGSALAEMAYDRIREAIANLTLQPGQAITEASTSEWLGIGRMPVREALLRLREEGLVELVPRRGYHVSRISPEKAQEIYEMLEGLESSAAKLAAQRIDTVGIARLEAAIVRLEKALESGDLAEWIAADDAIHETILEIAGNQQIQQAVQALKVKIRRMAIFTAPLRPDLGHSTRVHRRQAEAIQKGDWRTARELRQELWDRSAKEMVEIARRYAGPAAAL